MVFPFFFQVSRILYSFCTAFKRSSRQVTDVKDSIIPTPDSDVFTFSVSLEVKEDDGKGNFRWGYLGRIKVGIMLEI